MTRFSPSSAGRGASAPLGSSGGPTPAGPPLRAAGRPCLASIGIGQQAAEQAELWVDTPFVWGQSVRGRGCDCKGLIAGVARELGRPEGESVAALAQGYGAGRFVPGQLLAGLAGLFDRACEAEEGDIAVILIKGAPQHLAIVTCAVDGRPVRMVEAYLGLGRVRPVIVGAGHSFHSFWRWRDESVSSSSAAGGPE